jgi:hypothetical protein
VFCGRLREPWALRLLVPEMWATLAIVAMWLAVLFDSVYGPNIVNTTVGGDSSSVPSVVVVAPFAFLATWVVARYGFRHDRKA